MAGRALRLHHDLAIPFQAEPYQAVEDRVYGFLSGALAVGVLDPQAIDAAVMTGEQPVEQRGPGRSEEHTSELQSLMRISYAVFCSKKNTQHSRPPNSTSNTQHQ